MTHCLRAQVLRSRKPNVIWQSVSLPEGLRAPNIGARARVLRRVAESEVFSQRELNRAFVLMQYFGYLRRNPNETPEAGQSYDGYNFWLNKLNQFGGNFVEAEMVKAFLVSTEYRQKFAP